MATILDGKKISERVEARLKKRVAGLARKPKLVIIQIGDHEESNIYVKRKRAFGERIGVNVVLLNYKKNENEMKIISDILRFNKDKNVKGIMVQLPLPERFDKRNILDAIDPEKDVDGLTSASIKYLFDNTETFLPATTKAIIDILANYKISLAGKKVVMVGLSTLVGRPTMLALLNRKATVVACDIYTKNLEKETKAADIIIVAAGHKNLITKKHVKKGQVVIDIGINVTYSGGKRKIVGDADFENVKKIVQAITPVPGGVGPLTIASLFENLLKTNI
jgi:methylenetetrahydrofolate dehydrogenase (NADP+) / methenyltetrahydrofolate cyclohydrolase